MKHLYSIILLVWFKIDFVRAYSEKISASAGNICKPCICPPGFVVPIYGIILIAFTIVLMMFIILFLIYKLRQRVYCESIVDDKIDITSDDFSSKYVRQISSENNDSSLKHPSYNDENKFQLQRQNSKMTIVEYPSNLDVSSKNNNGPQTRTQNINKVLYQPVAPLQREYMEKICQGVLAKKQRISESNSLSNLNKILNENPKSNKGSETHIAIEKSASSPLLDMVENFETETLTPVKKEFPESTPQQIYNIDNKKTYLPFRLPKIVGNGAKDESDQDNKYMNSPNDINTLSHHDNDKHIDDVCDSITRPVLTSQNNEEQICEIYDNPPFVNRPVVNEDHLDDVYDSMPNNIPISDDEYLDDVYDNPLSNKPVFHSNSNKFDGEITNEEYDLPPKFNKGIDVTKSDDSDYVSPLTNEHETCFDKKYMNAKGLSFINSKLKKMQD